MIEMPVSTCEMVVEPKKKSRFFKQKLIKKVNKNAKRGAKTTSDHALSEGLATITPDEVSENERASVSVKQTPVVKKKFRFDLVAAEALAVFVLAVAIILTNIFWEDSGINAMVRTVFGTATQAASDERTAKDLAVAAPSASANVTLENGLMTFEESAAVYAPADGKVVSVTESDGKFTITISHSDVFKTIVSGADAAYVKSGDSVYVNIPVAYAEKGTVVALYNGDNLAGDYMIDGGRLIWQI